MTTWFDALSAIQTILKNDSNITAIVSANNIIIDIPQFPTDDYNQIILHEPILSRSVREAGCNNDVLTFWQFPIEIIIQGDIQDKDRKLEELSELQNYLIKSIITDSVWNANNDYHQNPDLSRDQKPSSALLPFAERIIYFELGIYIRF